MLGGEEGGEGGEERGEEGEGGEGGEGGESSVGRGEGPAQQQQQQQQSGGARSVFLRGPGGKVVLIKGAKAYDVPAKRG